MLREGFCFWVYELIHWRWSYLNRLMPRIACQEYPLSISAGRYHRRRVYFLDNPYIIFAAFCSDVRWSDYQISMCFPYVTYMTRLRYCEPMFQCWKSTFDKLFVFEMSDTGHVLNGVNVDFLQMFEHVHLALGYSQRNCFIQMSSHKCRLHGQLTLLSYDVLSSEKFMKSSKALILLAMSFRN